MCAKYGLWTYSTPHRVERSLAVGGYRENGYGTLQVGRMHNRSLDLQYRTAQRPSKCYKY